MRLSWLLRAGCCFGRRSHAWFTAPRLWRPRAELPWTRSFRTSLSSWRPAKPYKIQTKLISIVLNPTHVRRRRMNTPEALPLATSPPPESTSRCQGALGDPVSTHIKPVNPSVIYIQQATSRLKRPETHAASGGSTASARGSKQRLESRSQSDIGSQSTLCKQIAPTQSTA